MVALLPEMNEMDYAFRKDDCLGSLNNLQKAITILKKMGIVRSCFIPCRQICKIIERNGRAISSG